MSNILYFDDFREKHINNALSFETRFFEHTSANNNSVGVDKICELHELHSDLMPVISKYFDQLHNITDLDELIDSLQRVFVFLSQETKYD